MEKSDYSVKKVNYYMSSLGYELENKIINEKSNYNLEALKNATKLLFKKDQESIAIYIIEFTDAHEALKPMSIDFLNTFMSGLLSYSRMAISGNIALITASDEKYKEQVDKIYEHLKKNDN